MNKTTASLTSVAALAGLVAVALPPTTSAAVDPGAPPEPTALTYRLAAKDAETRFIDIGRKGDSVGDHYYSAITLKADGQVAGRLQVDCAVLDNAYEGHLCLMAVIVEGGQITLASGGVGKRIPNVDGRGDIYAVTGGTGSYQGAEGELTVSDDGRFLTVTILP